MSELNSILLHAKNLDFSGILNLNGAKNKVKRTDPQIVNGIPYSKMWEHQKVYGFGTISTLLTLRSFLDYPGQQKPADEEHTLWICYLEPDVGVKNTIFAFAIFYLKIYNLR